MDEVQKLSFALQKESVKIRRKALSEIAGKKGGQVITKIEDQRVVSVLRHALSDPDKVVRRRAAYALRPWTRKDPELFASILPEYAVQSFDGFYTHVGLLNTKTGEIWIPPWQSLSGHAALLDDGNTDQYFKFHFYLANQSPPEIRSASGCPSDAHLLVYHIRDWSYSRQEIISGFDARWKDENAREQKGFERRVVSFYRNCSLPFGVTVHRSYLASGNRAEREFAVSRIDNCK